ncbi:unnamed protein product [Schistocephalus solidus]|uniref:Uncharacterized protein n=1 Tax=Schistocephalus solidus TaxID=70667 RepID=A0A183SRP5_SCHSO|nr:unnamed protein product [Schistocephalus solidus]
MPTTKLNSSLKTPRTVQSLEQITNLNNDTTSSTNTFVSVDLPLPVNLPNERTPRQCIVQEGGATDSVYNVYSTARSILPHYSMPNQHAASTKMKEQVKLADISSSPYEFGVED